MLLSDLLAAWAVEIVAMRILAMLLALLALVISGSADGVGRYVADRQWFGATLAQMDFYYFNNSFLSSLL